MPLALPRMTLPLLGHTERTPVSEPQRIRSPAGIFSVYLHDLPHHFAQFSVPMLLDQRGLSKPSGVG